MIKWIALLKRYYRWLACLPMIAALWLLCVVIAPRIASSTVRYYDFEIIDLNEGWHDDDGTEYRLSDLPYGRLTLEHPVSDFDLTTNRLCMKSVDTFFEVFADGESVYCYFPEQPAILGESYGMYIHAIPLPVDTQTLTIELTPIYPNAPPALLSTVIEDPGMFIGDIFKDGLPGFSICILMVILGVIMVVIGIFSTSQIHNNQIEFFTLGVFSVFVGAWSVNDTLILQTITQMPAVVRLMNYLTLIFLPYFAVSFIANATNNAKSRLLPILYGLIWINFIVNIALTLADVSDYFDLVKITQIIIVIAVGITVYLVIYAARRKQAEKRFLRTLLIGTCALVIGTAIDLIRFRATTVVKQMTSSYSRMGTLFFLLFIGLYLIQENNRRQIETSRELERLAYSDGLTGLKNRFAFHEAEAALREDPNAKCTIIQFDVNNLKKVNDIYGHAEGDKHLSNAARVIRESIGQMGDCYRTGGDEFIAIISEQYDRSDAQRAIRQMEQLLTEYNDQEHPPVVLDIAYGMAVFCASEGSLEKAEQLADTRMYECKRVKKTRS